MVDCWIVYMQWLYCCKMLGILYLFFLRGFSVYIKCESKNRLLETCIWYFGLRFGVSFTSVIVKLNLFLAEYD